MILLTLAGCPGGGVFAATGFGGENAESIEDLKGAELEGGVIDLTGIVVAREVRGGFEAVADLADKGLFEEPILVTAIFPAGEVGKAEALASFTELFDDGGVGDTVLEHEVDFVANGFWKPGDVAIAATTGRIFEF